jgi:DNA-binding NarL/FixJ family response regulator
MDLKMPDTRGVEATHAIRADFFLAKIVVLSTYKGDQDIYRTKQAGAVTLRWPSFTVRSIKASAPIG